MNPRREIIRFIVVDRQEALTIMPAQKLQFQWTLRNDSAAESGLTIITLLQPVARAEGSEEPRPYPARGLGTRRENKLSIQSPGRFT